MINLEHFLMGLLLVSTITGLTTEAVKNMLVELDKPHPTNTLAGLISLAISTAIGTGYVVLSGLQFTQQLAVYLVALVFMSWLCAMVGYDKVVQTMTQMKSK